MWLLGIALRTSVRATSILSCWAISSAPWFCFWGRVSECNLHCLRNCYISQVVPNEKISLSDQDYLRSTPMWSLLYSPVITGHKDFIVLWYSPETSNEESVSPLLFYTDDLVNPVATYMLFSLRKSLSPESHRAPVNWEWWLTSIISALGRKRHMDLCEFQASLVYTATKKMRPERLSHDHLANQEQSPCSQWLYKSFLLVSPGFPEDLVQHIDTGHRTELQAFIRISLRDWMMKEQYQESNFRREKGQVSKVALGSDMLQRWVPKTH
jgi:hypothetical protein